MNEIKLAIAMVVLAIITLTTTVCLFGTSETTSAQLEREIRWEQTHQVIVPRQ